MKRRELVRKLIALGAELKREGSEHTIYVNPRTGTLLPVPRHATISVGVARDLLRRAAE